MLGKTNPLPFFFVGKAVTNERVKRFQTTKHPLLSESIGKTDTKAVWYSRDHIAQLLAEIDHAQADGLRIYFGTYEESHEYSNQSCLLMVLTQENPQTGGHSDITIENAEDFQSRSILEDKFGNSDQTESKKRDFNVGSPCPPICDGLSFPGNS